MKIKKSLVGFISLAFVLTNLSLGITTYVAHPDPIDTLNTCFILKK